MDLKLIAEENLTLVERGSYTGPSGSAVPLRDLVDASVRGTVLYRPNDFDSLPLSSPSTSPRRIEVTAETTANAARRLYESGARHIALLNFASARNPGGGFIRGAKAQEEDLARCSALYQCLMTQPRILFFSPSPTFDVVLGPYDLFA
ncbi:MAG: TIGR02452 family protein [Polyangiaceae bacterium]